jgi:uncharacterized protein YndB with AHSA1/START domain
VAHESFSVSEVIPARPEQIYSAWLSTEEHSAFTGDDATVEPFVGGKHSTFGGYAEGRTLELQPGRRIVQTWRSQDFPEGTPDSRLEVTLEETLGGTLVTILHTGIPDGQAERYREGWTKYYFEALKEYFGVREEDTSETSFAGHIAVETELDPLPENVETHEPMNGQAPQPRRARRPARKAPVSAKPAAKAKAKAATKPPQAKGKAKTKAKAKAAPRRAAKSSAAKKRPKPAKRVAAKAKQVARPTKTKAKAKAKPAKKSAPAAKRGAGRSRPKPRR